MKIVLVLVVLIGLIKASRNFLYGLSCPYRLRCSGFSGCLSPGDICNHKNECADGSDEDCCARCGYRPLIPHGVITLNLLDSSVGATADVTCDEGYQSCKRQVTCLPSFTWEISECTPIHSDTFECYTCDNEEDNDECNMKTETCEGNKQSCQTIVEWRRNKVKITKGCQLPDVAGENLGCQQKGKNKMVCQYKCDDHLCNEGIPNCAECGDHEEDKEDSKGHCCEAEHGPCNKQTYSQLQPLALRSSNCQNYCECTRKWKGGSITYQWQQKKCKAGYLFDNTPPTPTCRKKKRVTCHGPDEDDCTKEHGICNEEIMVKEPRKVLSKHGCKKYCECVINEAFPCGTPVFSWRESECPDGKLFDDSSKDGNKRRCKKSKRVTCNH